MEEQDYRIDARDYAMQLVEHQLVTADHLLLCALKFMSSDDVKHMLDINELSPRFMSEIADYEADND